MSILIVLRSRIWFCFISVIGHCSKILMYYIFTLICCQWVAIVLASFLDHDEGFWFGRYVVFHSFLKIRCSVYCDFIVLILSCLHAFLVFIYLWEHPHGQWPPFFTAALLSYSALYTAPFTKRSNTLHQSIRRKSKRLFPRNQ